jgi:hypothetical protein
MSRACAGQQRRGRNPPPRSSLQAGRFAWPTVHRGGRRADAASPVPLSEPRTSSWLSGPGASPVVNAMFDTRIPPHRPPVRGLPGHRVTRRSLERPAIRTPNFAPDGSERPAQTPVRTAVGRYSLARRKPGVQIPSPPPPTSQVRASPASSGRRSPRSGLRWGRERPREGLRRRLGSGCQSWSTIRATLVVDWASDRCAPGLSSLPQGPALVARPSAG